MDGRMKRQRWPEPMESLKVMGDQLTRMGYPPPDPLAFEGAWFGRALGPLIAASETYQMRARDELRWFVAQYEPSWLPWTQ